MKTDLRREGAAAPTAPEPTDSPAPELHHGDLRKGAFLRRRADYQMQASASTGRQAGDIAPPPGAGLPPKRGRG